MENNIYILIGKTPHLGKQEIMSKDIKALQVIQTEWFRNNVNSSISRV